MGKSTVLALAAGLLKAMGGELKVAGQALGQLAAASGDAWRAKTIDFLPQKLNLSAALKVAHNLHLAQWAAAQVADAQSVW